MEAINELLTKMQITGVICAIPCVVSFVMFLFIVGLALEVKKGREDE